jgi:hypothetical protein
MAHSIPLTEAIAEVVEAIDIRLGEAQPAGDLYLVLGQLTYWQAQDIMYVTALGKWRYEA